VGKKLQFVIRRSFLVPLGLLWILSLVLFAVSLVQGQPLGRIIILGVIILPVTMLLVESAFRRAVVNDEGVTVFKFLRRGRMEFRDITSVETVLVRKRAFLTLSSEEHFLIFSNAYADFPRLVREMLNRVPGEAVSQETRDMAAAPPVKSTEIISCWLGVLLLLLILYIQLGGTLHP